MIVRPSTSSAFANNEPRIDVWATTISPAASENSTMKSSGRLPSVDWSTPVTAGPKCEPTDSVADPDRPREPAERGGGHDEDGDGIRVGVVEQRLRPPSSAKIAPSSSRCSQSARPGSAEVAAGFALDEAHPVVHLLERRLRGLPGLLGAAGEQPLQLGRIRRAARRSASGSARSPRRRRHRRPS